MEDHLTNTCKAEFEPKDLEEEVVLENDYGKKTPVAWIYGSFYRWKYNYTFSFLPLLPLPLLLYSSQIYGLFLFQLLLLNTHIHK